jgi:hypothetical protein
LEFALGAERVFRLARAGGLEAQIAESEHFPRLAERTVGAQPAEPRAEDVPTRGGQTAKNQGDRTG